MAIISETIMRRLANHEPLMPPDIWAKAYDHIETDITPEKIAAEIEAATALLAEQKRQAAVDLELLRSRVESEGD